MSDQPAADVGARARATRYAPAAVGLLVFAVLLAVTAAGGRLDDVPEAGDGHDYDALGLNLARGRGFGFFWSDPELREPYLREADRGRLDYIHLMRRQGPFVLTAYRPPVLPAILAAIYATVGRHFFIWRVLNCAIFGLGAALTCLVGRRLGGTAVGIVAGLCFAAAPEFRFFAGRYMTEGLAVLAVCLVALALIRLIEQPTGWRFATLGAALAAAVLTRSIFVFLVPFAWLAAWRAARRDGRAWLGRCALLGAVTVGLFAPWGVRNCLVLKAFMPVGVHGWTNLPAGYSDECLRTRGNWSYPFISALHEREREKAGRVGETGPAVERWAAEVGRDYAWRWIKANPGKLPWLFVLKVKLHWTPDTWAAVVFAFAVVGVVLVRLRPPAPALYWLLLANTLAVGLTWSTSGRFRVPVMPLVYILAAAGAAFPRGHRPAPRKSTDGGTGNEPMNGE